MKLKATVILLSVVAATVFTYTQLTIFVIQPLGALPEGRTLILWRLTKTKFIDSADSVCKREMGGVNLFCRAAVLDAVAKANSIILRLPYSNTLYLASTGGSRYSK